MGRRPRPGARAAVVLLAAACLGAAGAAPAPAVVPGVFVTVEGGTVEEERAAVEALTAPGSPHVHRSSPLYLGALALRETVACTDGGTGPAPRCSLIEAVDSYAALFPAFKVVWLGVAQPPKTDGGYCEAWLHDDWVRALVENVAAAGQLVSRRFGGGAGPGAPRFGWYMSHEGFIEHLHEGCRAQNGTFVPAEAFAPALASGMAAAVGALRALEPDWPVLWSPSARENPGHNLDRAAFRAAAAAFHAAVGLDEIHVQDAVGKASALMTNGTIQYMTGCEHAAAIVEVLASLGGPAAAVNMELFVRQREHFGPEAHHRTVVGDPLEHARRRACYLGRGVDLGVSWEALWYRRSLYTDVAWAGAESVGGGADPVCPAG